MRSYPAAALLSVAFFFLFAGLITLRWELVGLAMPIVLLFYLSALLNRPPIIDLEVQRETETQQLLEGDELMVRLTVRNLGEPIDLLQLRDTIPKEARIVRGRAAFPLSLDKGQTVHIEYVLVFDRRGRYDFGPLLVEWKDTLRLVASSKSYALAGTAQVLPNIHNLRKSDLRPTKVRVHVGNVPSRLLGPGMEFYCLRDYVDGDELRRVNWKATAKRDRLITNDFNTERSGDVAIVLDARSELEEEAGVLIDKEVEAAASMTHHFLGQRNRVGMISLGEVHEVVRLGYGRRHFHRIVESLLKVQAGPLKSTASIPLAISRYFPANCLLLVISLLEDEAIVRTVQSLSLHGRDMIVLTLSPISLKAGALEGTEAAQLAVRLEQLKRENLVAELRRYCRVVDWDPRSPLGDVLVGVNRWQLDPRH